VQSPLKRTAKSDAELAIFGAAPRFPDPLHVGRPNVGDRTRLLARIEDALDRRWLTNGGLYEAEFERRLSELIGVKHCVAITNGTLALDIACRALGLAGEVIVPSFTFIATAHALLWQGLTPVFCDIEPRNHTLDPIRVEELITPRTSAILGVHTWGRSCDVEALAGIAQRHGLELLFDAAHALACTHKGRMIGQFGHAEVFSFHATKFVNSLEGGAIATNDDQLAARVRLLKNFGFTRYDEVAGLGTNGKMNEISAAMGITSLDAIDEIVAANRRNFAAYVTAMDGIPGVTLLPYDDKERCNCQYVVALVDETKAGLSRDELVEVLWWENVLARRYFYPGCHRMEPYRSTQPLAWCHLPQTERIANQVVVLPTGTAIGPVEISAIAEVLRLAVASAESIYRRLRSPDNGAVLRSGQLR
jgi:dTDP-4-amino-4,6-dideoxygalactose transaminase